MMVAGRPKPGRKPSIAEQRAAAEGKFQAYQKERALIVAQAKAVLAAEGLQEKTPDGRTNPAYSSRLNDLLAANPTPFQKAMHP